MFINLRIVTSSHVRKALYRAELLPTVTESLRLFLFNCHSFIVRESSFCGIALGVIIPDIISLHLEAADISIFPVSRK